MNWFRRPPVPESADPQPQLHAYEVLADTSTRTAIDFADKPEDLVRAAEVREWTRPPIPLLEQVQALTDVTLHWQRTPPTVPGVYWFVEHGGSSVHLCVVLEFGRLCVRERTPDGCRYVALGQLQRYWAGPVSLPEGVSLDDVDPRIAPSSHQTGGLT